LNFFINNNHLFKNLKSGYELYQNELKNSEHLKCNFDLTFQNKDSSNKILLEKGAFKSVEDQIDPNININDCVEGFVVDKNINSKSNKFQISNIKWNTPHLEEMIFTWLFP